MVTPAYCRNCGRALGIVSGHWMHVVHSTTCYRPRLGPILSTELAPLDELVVESRLK